MALIRYIGSHRAGIYLPGDRPVPWGEPVEVDDDLAAELCARSYCGVPEWEPADPPKPAKSAKE